MARRPVHMKKTSLSSSKRASLRASDFAVPSERKYPINDLFHARLALTYVLTPSNAAYRDEVVRAVLARYPELQFWWAARSKGLAVPARQRVSARKVANPRKLKSAAPQLFRGDVVEYESDDYSATVVVDRMERKNGSSYLVGYEYEGFAIDLDDPENIGGPVVRLPLAGAKVTRMNPSHPMKRAQKGTRRAASGQRMVANPEREDFPIDPFELLFELYELETRVKTMPDADVRSALAESKKKLKSATDRLHRVQESGDHRAATEASQVRGHYAGMCFILETELAERGLQPFPRHGNPRREVETEEYFAAMEPTRAKYAERSPEELLIARSVALKALNKRFAGKSSREVAKALGLDPNDASIIAALEELRSGPYNINPHYEQQARRLAIARGRHVAPSGRLEQVDYRKKLRLPAHSPEELFGSLEAGIRAVKPHEDKSNRDIARALGLDAYDPLTLATLENLRDGLYTSNPRRKLPKSGEGKGIVSRAERGIGTKYRTMREGMLLEGGDVMLLPHRLPGHEGKRMTDLSEAGREWDYEYNDAKPILDLLAASKAPMLRTTTVAKKLKEEGMSVDEVFRGFAFLRSHGLLKQPRDGYVALAKANPRPATHAKRTGSRTAAQNNAAKAMKLFHSGQASSLAEAWAMLRRR